VKIDPQTGLLDFARQCPSPNHDARPNGCTPDLIVLHNISLPPYEFGGYWIDQLFTNQLDLTAHPFFAEICHLRVASHLLIRREGEIVQYVPRFIAAPSMQACQTTVDANVATTFPSVLKSKVRTLKFSPKRNINSLKAYYLP